VYDGIYSLQVEMIMAISNNIVDAYTQEQLHS